jgi:hypothetical protein
MASEQRLPGSARVVCPSYGGLWLPGHEEGANSMTALRPGLSTC